MRERMAQRPKASFVPVKTLEQQDLQSLQQNLMAEFYLSRKAWISAANRAKKLLEHFQGNSSVKRALQIQLLSYQQIGLTQLEDDTRRILVDNYGE